VSLIHVIYASLATRAFRGHEIPTIQRLLQSKRENFSPRTTFLIRLRALHGWIQAVPRRRLPHSASAAGSLKPMGCTVRFAVPLNVREKPELTARELESTHSRSTPAVCRRASISLSVMRTRGTRRIQLGSRWRQHLRSAWLLQPAVPSTREMTSTI
jgi:hypothetical protein